MVDENIGKRIKEYREKAGITQEYLSEKVGIAPASLSNIERGIHYPTLENFIRIANIIGVSADVLLLDVVDHAGLSKETELSEKLSQASPKKRKEIYDVIDVMLEHQ